MSGNSHQRKVAKNAARKSVGGINTDRLLGIIGLALGVVLAFIGVMEVFPLFINMPIYCVGIVCILFGLWKWEATATWSRRIKVLVSLVVFSSYAGLLKYPVTKQYQHETVPIAFKDSPLFTFYRRQVIRWDVTRTRNYLNDLGIKTPDDIPPFGVETRPDAGKCGEQGSGGITGTISVGKQYLDNRMAATCAYLVYVVSDQSRSLLDFAPDAQTNKININNFEIYSLLNISFVDYFNQSFWDVRGSDLAGWANVFWEIRNRFGKAFADQLAANVLRMASMDKEQIGEPAGAYFARKLQLADSSIDNEGTKWPEIHKILASTGGFLADDPHPGG